MSTMQSKIFIDLNTHKEVHLRVTYNDSEDVRDKMVGMFVNDATPGRDEGFCLIRFLPVGIDTDPRVYEIVPIHPLEMPDFIKLILENATSRAYGSLKQETKDKIKKLLHSKLFEEEGETPGISSGEHGAILR